MTGQTEQLTEATDPLCLPPARAAALLADSPWRRFLVLGDSLAAGVGGPTPGYEPGPWPRRVVRALRANAPATQFVTVARDGATTTDVLDSQLAALATVGPDLVHVSVGANDLWRRRFDVAEVRARLDEIFARCTAAAGTVTTFTLGKQFDIAQVPGFRDRVVLLNELIRDLGSTRGVTVIDCYDHPVTDRPNLLSDDGIHFAAMGQAVLAAEVVRTLAALARTARS